MLGWRAAWGVGGASDEGRDKLLGDADGRSVCTQSWRFWCGRAGRARDGDGTVGQVGERGLLRVAPRRGRRS